MLVEVLPSIPKNTPAGGPDALLAVLFITCEPFVDIGKFPPLLKPVAKLPIVPLFEPELELCKFCGAGKLKAIIKDSRSYVLEQQQKPRSAH